MAEEKLVMVDKTRLAELQANHREMVEMAHQVDTTALMGDEPLDHEMVKKSLKAMWLLLGTQTAVIDEILRELIGDE